MISGDKIVSGQEYWFIVKAVNAAGEGPFSPAVRIVAASVPNAPEASIAESTASSLEVEWKAPTEDNG